MSGRGRREPGQDDLTEGLTPMLSPEGWNRGRPVENWSWCTGSPSLSFPNCEECRVEPSLPLRRSQADVETEPQTAATHVITQVKGRETHERPRAERAQRREGWPFLGGSGRCPEEQPSSWPSGSPRG